MPASKAAKPKAPTHLAKHGRAVWRAITEKYDLRADELFTLEDVCRITDEIAELVEDWDRLDRPRLTTGSMGQLVEHPHPKRITDLRMKRNVLWRMLKLPDDPAGTDITPNQNRDAANASWSPGVRSSRSGA